MDSPQLIVVALKDTIPMDFIFLKVRLSTLTQCYQPLGPQVNIKIVVLSVVE